MVVSLVALPRTMDMGDNLMPRMKRRSPRGTRRFPFPSLMRWKARVIRLDWWWTVQGPRVGVASFDQCQSQ